MRDEHEVWQALLRRKGLSISELAARLGITRQHAHRVLTGRRPAEMQRDELEAALSLGTPAGNRPLFAIGEFDDTGELDLVPAGDAQPLFADRELAAGVARDLEDASQHVCVLPVWPAYAWRNLVTFHAAWGAEPEPRKIFVVDRMNEGVPLEAVIDEIRAGLEATLRTRAQAYDARRLGEIEARLERLH